MSDSYSPQDDAEISASNAVDLAPAPRQETPTRKPWRRFALLVLLVQTTLFWQGCEQQQVLVSLGLVGPAVTVAYGDPAPPLKLVDVSVPFVVANLVAVALAVSAFAYAALRWADRATSTRVLVAAALATAIYNSILFFPVIWLCLVAIPLMWLVLVLFPNSFGDAAQEAVCTLSRAYYLVGIAAIWGVLSLVRLASRRYLFVHPDRWQFSLAGLLALMVLLGTGIGMLLRLIFS